MKTKIEELEKQLAELKAEFEKSQKQEIKTVEDAFNKLNPEWFINTDGSIDGYVVTGNFYNHIFEQNQCNMTSEKEAKRIKALIQLRLIAEAMNEGVERGDYYWFIGTGYIVNSLKEDLLVPIIIDPTFYTKELAEKALKNFKPLFEDLYAE
jgi:hypothetical protein